MFTGIVERRGTVTGIEPVEFGRVLRVDPGGWTHRAAAGESISVNGCCLTVTADPGGPDGHLRFDVIRQTLRCTTLGDLEPGDGVNLEHAVTPATLLGGHVVQGHVDGVGEVTSVRADPDERRVAILAPVELASCIVEKGSIAVDGVSLTVAATGPDDGRFEVALIPTTLDLTTLDALSAGDRVNLETDYIVKTVVSWLERRAPS